MVSECQRCSQNANAPACASPADQAQVPTLKISRDQRRRVYQFPVTWTYSRRTIHVVRKAISRISLFPAIMFVLAGKVATPSDAPPQPLACRNRRWCGCRAPLGRHRSGLGPRTAPECSLTFLLTKPRLMGIVYGQVCVRGRKGAAHAEPATVRPPLPPGTFITTKCHFRELAY